MIYSYLLTPPKGDTISIFFALVIGSLLSSLLHDAVQLAVLRQPVRGLLIRTVKDPYAWAAVLASLVFGISWRRTVSFGTDSRARLFLTSISGPAACFAVGIIAFLISDVFFSAGLMLTARIINTLMRIFVFSALFSLCPVLPFDGGHLILSILPERLHDFFLKSEEISPIVMPGLIIILVVTGELPLMKL